MEIHNDYIKTVDLISKEKNGGSIKSNNNCNMMENTSLNLRYYILNTYQHMNAR